MHIYQDAITEDKISLRELPVNRSTIVLIHLLTVIVIFGFIYSQRDYKLTVPVLPKQYPRDAHSGEEKHYKI